MNQLDTAILHALYAIRSGTVVNIFIGITELGSEIMIGGIAVALSLYLILRRKLAYFAGLCVSILGTIVVVFPLKEIVARARPDLIYRAFDESGFSFPSGHAAFSIALYGFLAYLAWKLSPVSYRVPALVCAGILIALIGLSRLYLGLHFVSDVVAGYVIGGAFLALGIWTSERLKRSPIWS